eukprot:3878195-Pleurochrysis_carterae.AAC.3
MSLTRWGLDCADTAMHRAKDACVADATSCALGAFACSALARELRASRVESKKPCCAFTIV